jgi:hypothetical protein
LRKWVYRPFFLPIHEKQINSRGLPLNKAKFSKEAEVLAKKFFGLSLLFNSLLTVAYGASVFVHFNGFFPGWQLFYPFVLYGFLFWMVAIAGTLNIAPSAFLSRKLKTGRFLFHHFVYGFFVIIIAYVYVVAFTGINPLTLFTVYETDVPINVSRFFVIIGLTLFIDDLPDVHASVESTLNQLKQKAHGFSHLLTITHFLAGIITLYVALAISIAMWQHQEWATLQNFILTGNILVTGIVSFVFIKKRVWFKIGN